jgi:hypothetical protein
MLWRQRYLQIFILSCSSLISLSAMPLAASKKHSSTTRAKLHSVAFDATAIINGGLAFRYEYSALPYLNISIPLEGQLLSLSPLSSEFIAGSRILGWSWFPHASAKTGVGAKFHYAGWYVEPLIKVGFAEIQFAGSALGTRYYALLQPEVMIGHQAAFDFGLFLNVGIGLGARIFLPATEVPPYWQPDAVIAVGYTW